MSANIMRQEAMIDPLSPVNEVGLVGRAIQRGVTLALRTEEVLGFLPHGMTLGKQSFTRPGTHPVSIAFYNMYNVRMNVPAFVPDLTYYEQVIGVPYVYTDPSLMNGPRSGPFFYMPALKLSSFWATLGGLVYWGYNKQVADVITTNTSYTVKQLNGPAMMKFSFDEPEPLPAHAWRQRVNFEQTYLRKYPKFRHTYEMFQQPFVSCMPAGLGPFFITSMLKRIWDQSTLRPLTGSVLEIYQRYVNSLPTGTFECGSIEQDVLGAYELITPWLTTLPYPTWFHPPART